MQNYIKLYRLSIKTVFGFVRIFSMILINVLLINMLWFFRKITQKLGYRTIRTKNPF